MILESLKNVDEHVEVHKWYASEMELYRKICGETCRMISKLHRPLRPGEMRYGNRYGLRTWGAYMEDQDTVIIVRIHG